MEKRGFINHQIAGAAMRRARAIPVPFTRMVS
jgi:hypothetical protein